MYISQKYLTNFICSLIVVLMPFTVSCAELSEAETRQIQIDLSTDFAADYLDEMNQIQTELYTKHQGFKDLIMAGAGGSLNLRLPEWLESEAKLKGVKVDAPTMFLILSISTMKLGLLAQQFGLLEAAGCHFKESRKLAAVVKGEAPELASCRALAYKDVESNALRLSATREAEAATKLTHKWVKFNMLYSKALACTSGYCI